MSSKIKDFIQDSKDKSEQNVNLASTSQSNSSEHEKKTGKVLDKKQFGKCKICNDKASGIHYGVASCEGCKGFYKRTIVNKRLYHCTFGNKCEITTQHRRKCKACRFTRCLSFGMSMDGIKMGRITLMDKIKLMHLNILKDKNEGTSKELMTINEEKTEETDSQSQFSYGSTQVSSNEKFSSVGKSSESPSDEKSDTSPKENSKGVPDNGQISPKDKKREEQGSEELNEKEEMLRLFHETVEIYEKEHSERRESNEEEIIKSYQENIEKFERESSKNSDENYDESDESYTTGGETTGGETDDSNTTKGESTDDNTDVEVESVRKKVESQLKIFENRKSNKRSLKEREKYIKENYDLDFFFKSQLKLYQSSRIITEKSYHDLFFNMENENILFLLTIIRDKVYQLYIELIKPLEKNIEQAHELIKNKIKTFEGHEVTKEKAWQCHITEMKNQAQLFVAYGKSLPGFNNISSKDFTAIIGDNLAVLVGFKITKLYIKNECYYVIDHIQMCKYWLRKFFGEAILNNILDFHHKLNNLKLSNHELALMIPFVLTSTEVELEDEHTVRELNLYYARALIYELSLNCRSSEFVKEISNVLGKIHLLKKCFECSSNQESKNQS